jgi:uncharacterized protein (UPF0179 family)
MMPLVTLIGERLAKKGKEIVFFGVIMGCKDCKLKSACLNLDKGKRYVIRDVRENRHECKIHEDGVRVVEIERVPLRTAVNRRGVVEGAVITFKSIDCRNLGCPSYKVCHPLGLESGTKGKVVRLGQEISCPRGFELREVQLF